MPTTELDKKAAKEDLTDRFLQRHVGPTPQDIKEMLKALGYESLDALVSAVIPKQIRAGGAPRTSDSVSSPFALEIAGRGEHEVLAELKKIASQNEIFRSYIGMGYSDCVTPGVILRNIVENPGWYTAYTPYQAEIAQGRLEALLNFQTMIMDLTGLEVANASLLDEATAAAEAMHMCHALRFDESVHSFFVSKDCHPQTIEVVKTRATPLGIEVIVGDHDAFNFTPRCFGALVQYPKTDGIVCDYEEFCEVAHKSGALVIAAADLLSLTLLKAPGEFGADIAIGNSQRFGVPLGFGGPHAAFMATKDAYKRQMPGRIVGVSKDAAGKPALRLSLQTREQHIRREKATSNICTAQVLLAVVASMYSVYHGPEGLRNIARRVHRYACALAEGLRRLGYEIGDEPVFDTVRVPLGPYKLEEVLSAAKFYKINLRALDKSTVAVALDEMVGDADLIDLFKVFAGGKTLNFMAAKLLDEVKEDFAPAVARSSAYLTHPVFNRYHSETEIQRYMRRLEAKDLSLTTSMIPLGSCTMKLNAAAEMLPVTWPEFGKLHPFAPRPQTRGYLELFGQLEKMLCDLTGFAAVSLMPNAGSQGEYAGLLVIREFYRARGESHRDVCLIPQSAHGTNPASAVMAGMKVVVVNCDSQGNIDVADLRAKAQANRSNLAALMVTYPSTHGVFEESIREIIDAVHECGGQVYMDGANFNAMVGLCRPADFGADVSHMNLHKTFCIPHGGGGPGMGPIGVRSHLASYLPKHPVVETGGREGIGPVSAAPWGSPSILPISWVYIRLMGLKGLAEATQAAILNANYIAKKLSPYYPVLYKGKHGLVAHECILDLRGFKSGSDIQVEDVAKRLMDYGFHAPTISWPVAGTMMVEPTESESKAELDRFCDAMIAIHGEIREIEKGLADRADNALKNAPHTAEQVTAGDWNHKYSREKAAYPAPWLKEHKYWPPVRRIDAAFGDRNFICSCPPMESCQS